MLVRSNRIVKNLSKESVALLVSNPDGAITIECTEIQARRWARCLIFNELRNPDSKNVSDEIVFLRACVCHERN